MHALTTWQRRESVSVEQVPDSRIEEPIGATIRVTSSGIQLRMGQAHVRRWTDDKWPLVLDEADPLGARALATLDLSLDDAPQGYEMCQKGNGCIKVVRHA